MALRERAIEAHRRAEDAARRLERAHERFVTVIDGLDTAVHVADARSGEILFANRAFLAMTGYTPEELIGRNCRFLQGPETDRESIAQVRAALREQP